jgi:hypothetical protein
VRLLVDNLGRFNYGPNLGERKGLTENLYWDGSQEDLSRGWTALWQEAGFAGEAIAGASPAHVRPDAVGVDLSNFSYRGPDVWLLRDFKVRPGRQALLYVTGDRSTGALFVNGQPLARFSRHYGGGFFKHDITYLLRAGGNVLALYLRDYAGLPWHAWLLTYDAGQPAAGAWQVRCGVTPSGVWQSGLGDAGRPRFWRASFRYDPAEHGSGPFKLDVRGLVKGQLWVNGQNLGRYWQIGPQEYYKLPASWLGPENELLVFEEGAGRPEQVRIAREADALDLRDWRPDG